MNSSKMILAASGLVFFCWSPAVAQEPTENSLSLPTPPKVEFQGRDSELSRLLKRRYEAAQKGYQAFVALETMGRAGPQIPEVATAVQRVVTAGMELDSSAANRIRLLEFKVAYWTLIERATKQRFEVGAAGTIDVENAVYMKIDAEIELLRAKQAAAKK